MSVWNTKEARRNWEREFENVFVSNVWEVNDIIIFKNENFGFIKRDGKFTTARRICDLTFRTLVRRQIEGAIAQMGSARNVSNLSFNEIKMNVNLKCRLYIRRQLLKLSGQLYATITQFGSFLFSLFSPIP